MLNVFETDYQLQYSESYTGTLHQEAAIEGYQCCTSLLRAFESLLAENYTNFVLTVGCTALAIYCNGNVGFKIFDSHARDSYGRSHAQGTCVLLEVLSLSELVHCFQSIHNNAMFEVKGVIISEAENDLIVQTCVSETMKFKLSTTVVIYSLCYSEMKSCANWTSKTLSFIVDNGKRLCDRLSLDMNSPSNKNLPKSVDFCGVEVILDFKSDIIEGVLFESMQSKSVLQNAIKNNSECTGFLIWFASL